MPKANIFKSSEVFKHLNAEAMKTKAEKEQETKRWTTFLQKPDRPIPKSKAQLEQERRQALAYRVVISKQPKPRCAPNRTPTPPRQIEEPAILSEPNVQSEPQQAADAVESNVENENVNETIGDSEVPNLEQSENGVQIDESTQSTTAEAQNEVTAADDTTDEQTESNNENSDKTENKPEKTDEELLIEKQLADVQKQLMALSTLPLTIQATLDAVTRQLADIMPTMKLQAAPIKNGIQALSDGTDIANEGRHADN